MRKTDKLIRHYYRMLVEQTPGEPGLDAPPGMEDPQAPAPAPGVEKKPMDENEKYIVKILTNAFIFNPTLFGNRKSYIDNTLSKIKTSVNIPVATIIKEIKRIIAMDKSLYIESRTNFLIKRYYKLLEQDERDATEPQKDAQEPVDTDGDVDDAPQETESENDLDLVEIFPLYKELLLRALAHVPSEEELMMLKPVVSEFADTDPQKIVELIESLLLKSPKAEDKAVADQLSEV